MCTLFANLYMLSMLGPHMVYLGTPYIFNISMIKCGWLVSLWIFSISFFMVSWGFGFWMRRQTVARVVLYLMSAEYSVVMCGAWQGTLVTWPWLRLSMIYCCALRLWSQICVTCRRSWFPVSVTLSCCVGARCLGPVGWLHTFEMVTEHFANPNWVWLLRNAGF